MYSHCAYRNGRSHGLVRGGKAGTLGTIADADAATNDEADDETDDEDDYKENGVQIVVATLLSRLLGVGVSESDRKCSSSGAAIVLVDLGATACQRFACRPGRAFAALALFDR